MPPDHRSSRSENRKSPASREPPDSVPETESTTPISRRTRARCPPPWAPAPRAQIARCAASSSPTVCRSETSRRAAGPHRRNPRPASRTARRHLHPDCRASPASGYRVPATPGVSSSRAELSANSTEDRSARSPAGRAVPGRHCRQRGLRSRAPRRTTPTPRGQGPAVPCATAQPQFRPRLQVPCRPVPATNRPADSTSPTIPLQEVRRRRHRPKPAQFRRRRQLPAPPRQRPSAAFVCSLRTCHSPSIKFFYGHDEVTGLSSSTQPCSGGSIELSSRSSSIA